LADRSTDPSPKRTSVATACWQRHDVVAAMVTVIAVPMIHRANREPPSKALLLQDVSTNLTVLLAVLGGATLVADAIRVARDRSVAGRPPLDEASAGRRAEDADPTTFSRGVASTARRRRGARP
jgi:hypothetical protein